MENKKILSISIAAYNVEKYLKITLESLMRCKYLDKLEVLIVNDGSTDKTKEIAEEYVLQSSDIFKLINKKNGGYGSTINSSIIEAKGKYFKLLDGDDWFETDSLNEYILYLEELESDCIYTPYYKIDDNKNTLQVNSECNRRGEFGVNHIAMHSLTFNTSLLKKACIRINENCFYTDAEYNVKALLEVSKIDFFDRPIYCYRVGNEGQSISKSGWLKHYEEHNKVTLEIMRVFTDNNIKNKHIFLENILRLYIQKIYKTNFFVAVELNNREIWKNYVRLDKEVRKRFPEFYKLANRKMKILRLLYSLPFMSI